MGFLTAMKERTMRMKERVSKVKEAQRINRMNKKRIALADLEAKNRKSKEEYELDRSLIKEKEANTKYTGGGLLNNIGKNVKSNIARNIQKSKRETSTNIFTQTAQKSNIYSGSNKGPNPFTIGSGNNPYNFTSKKKRR